MIDASFAIMHKMRPEHERAEITEVTGRVRDKVAIIGDDVTITGGTLIAGAQALKEHGATRSTSSSRTRSSRTTRSSESRSRRSTGSSSPTRCRSTARTPDNMTCSASRASSPRRS
jgi:hypothetical protein